MPRLSPDEDIFNNPPKPNVPDWLKQYIDEENGLVDHDQLIRDGRYNEYQRWQQEQISPVPPSVVENTAQEGHNLVINVWTAGDGNYIN